MCDPVFVAHRAIQLLNNMALGIVSTQAVTREPPSTITPTSEKQLLPKDLLAHSVKIEGKEIDKVVLKTVANRDRRTPTEIEQQIMTGRIVRWI